MSERNGTTDTATGSLATLVGLARGAAVGWLVRAAAWAAGPQARAAAPVALLLALPLVMLALNRAWIFPRPDTVDPWMYVGFFLHPRHHLAQFPDVYHGSRLPILLPGVAAYQLLPPVGATVALHLAQYYAAVFALYAILCRAAGRRAALLGAVLFGTNGMLLSAVGQGHADGFGVPYFLLTTLALTRAAAGPAWPAWAAAAGAGAALFFFTNIAYGVHSLFFPWFLYAASGYSARRAAARGAVAGGGFLAASAALCAANWLLCGRVWFFLASVKVSGTLLANSWSCTGGRYAWVLHAAWLVVPVGAAVCGLVAWRRGALSGPWARPLGLPLVAGLAGLLVVLGGLEAGRVVHFLQFSFYANNLLPLSFLTAGVLLAGWADGLSGPEYRAAVGAAAGVGVLAALAGTGGALTPVALLAAPAAALGLAVALIRDPELPARHTGAFAAGVLGLVNLLVGAGYDRFVTAFPLERGHTPGEALVGRWTDPLPGVRTDVPRPTREQVMRATAEGLGLVVARDANHDLVFWYDVAGPANTLATPLVSAMMWDRRMVGMYYPIPFDHTGGRLPLAPGQLVAVVTFPGRDVVGETGPALSPVGLRLIPVLSYPFLQHRITAEVTVCRVEPVAPPAGSEATGEDGCEDNEGPGP